MQQPWVFCGLVVCLKLPSLCSMLMVDCKVTRNGAALRVGFLEKVIAHVVIKP